MQFRVSRPGNTQQIGDNLLFVKYNQVIMHKLRMADSDIGEVIKLLGAKERTSVSNAPGEKTIAIRPESMGDWRDR